MNYRAFRKIITSVVTCVLLLAGSVNVPARSVKSIADLRAEHRALVNQWLALNPWLRLATDNDCTNKAGLRATRQEYGRGYEPYYAVGDFNSDGREDFAVVLINLRKRSRRFAIAIFNGPFNRSHARAPAFFTDGIDLSDGGLIMLPGNQLVIGVFQTDNCVLLLPQGRGYAMKDCS